MECDLRVGFGHGWSSGLSRKVVWSVPNIDARPCICTTVSSEIWRALAESAVGFTVHMFSTFSQVVAQHKLSWLAQGPLSPA